MKYAFIALIACYLLVYGCGPDNPKKTENKKEQAVHSVVEKPQQPAQQIATPPSPPVSKAPPAQQPTSEVPPPPPQVSEAPPPPPTVIEEQKQQPCNMMVESPSAVELTQPDDQNIVVLPCGRMFIEHRIPANAPCLNAQAPPCPMMDEKELEGDEAYITMPCGRVFVRQPMMEDNANLELPQQMVIPDQTEVQPHQFGQASEEDLTTAVQRMVDTTNDMVLVTRQLVAATQEMLKATQGNIGANANFHKENLQTEPAAQVTEQTTGAANQNKAEVEALKPKQ